MIHPTLPMLRQYSCCAVDSRRTPRNAIQSTSCCTGCLNRRFPWRWCWSIAGGRHPHTANLVLSVTQPLPQTGSGQAEGSASDILLVSGRGPRRQALWLFFVEIHLLDARDAHYQSQEGQRGLFAYNQLSATCFLLLARDRERHTIPKRTSSLSTRGGNCDCFFVLL